MLCGLEKSFETWRCRVAFCAGLGLLVAIINLGDAIWWHHPWGWTLAKAAYNLILFAIAGLVIAKYVTPKAAAAAG